MKKVLYIFITLLITFSAQSSFAATPTEYTLLEPLPCIAGTGTDCKEGETINKISIDGYVGYVFKFAIALAVLLATVMIIIGGFQYMFSDSPIKIGDGKDRIKNAIYGLLAALASYLILQTIDPRLVQIHTNIDPICPPGLVKNADSICYPKGLLDFNNKFNKDLKALTDAERNEIVDLENAVKSLEKQQSDIRKKFEAGELDEEQTSKEMTKLGQQINGLKATQNQKIASSLVITNFRTAMDIINDTSSYTSDARYTDKTTGVQPLIRNSEQSSTIQQSIEEQKLKILKTSDEYAKSIGDKDIAKSQLLKKQAEFLNAEITKQKSFVKDVQAYKNSTGENVVYKGKFREILEGDLTEFQKEYDDPQKAVAVELGESYKSLQQQRIALIKTTLNN